MAKTKNRFEQVDEVQPDAITLSLSKNGEKAAGVVIFPASASSGRLAQDSVSGELAPLEAVLQMRRFDPDAVLSGDPNRPSQTTELWTFARHIGGAWKLSAIQETQG